MNEEVHVIKERESTWIPSRNKVTHILETPLLEIHGLELMLLCYLFL